VSGRRRLAAAALVAGSVLLAGCGGSDIPDDASMKDFCEAGDTFARATKFSDGVKAADGLHDTGTPKGIPGGARDGFELVVEIVSKSDDQADLEKRYKKLSAKQKKSVEQLDDFIAKKC
jgi:hypothetical protein